MFLLATYFWSEHQASEDRDRILSLSNDSGVAVEVVGKTLKVEEDNQLIYTLLIDDIGQLGVSKINVSQEEYNLVNDRDIVRIKIEDSKLKFIEKIEGK